MRSATIIRFCGDDTRLLGIAASARAEGFSHIDRLIETWRIGANRINCPGEALFAAGAAGEIIAVGGLNRDPNADDPQIGRVRHLYALPAHRRTGVGRLLVREIIEHARGCFDVVRVRAAKGDAPRFYDAIGFKRADQPHVSHILSF